jgi:pyrimidine operon attenuation protein/uracil phosphoribosyltransferase
VKEIMDAIQVSKTLKRISHEIIERHQTLDDVVLMGVKTKGTPVAEAISTYIKDFTSKIVPVYEIDIAAYRDDEKKSKSEKLNAEVGSKTVIIVDDVLFTGRSARAAMDAILDIGRASKIELAVLVDRGHRELPIRADYVGKNLPTSLDEVIFYDVTNQKLYIKQK